MIKFDLTNADIEAIEMALLYTSMTTDNLKLSAEMENALTKIRAARKEIKAKEAA